MAFVRIKIVRGKQYRYEEHRWREGSKVRSRSVCLGPASGGSGGVGGDEAGWLRRQFPRTHGIDWDAIARQTLEREKADNERRAEHLAQLHAAYGLKLGPATPVEVEKPAANIDLSASPPTGDEKASPDEGEAEAPDAEAIGVEGQ